MRVTYRGTRKNLSNKHNDRKFDISKAEHIDAEKQNQNVYWHAFKKDNPNMTFEEAEKMAYKDLFSDYVDYQNKKHIERRQYKRVRTTDDIWQNKNTKPEEVIFQIGSKDDFPDQKVFGAIWIDLNKRMNKWRDEHGNCFYNLNFSVHLDETTPHVHLRRVWVARDPETGFKIPRQELALEQAGVPLPDPTKPKSRTNNRKITFDKMVRGWFQEVCLEHGLDITTEPLPTRKHKDKETYINEQIQAKQKELERLTANVEIAKRLEKELNKNR
jgi:hypothetical protein